MTIQKYQKYREFIIQKQIIPKGEFDIYVDVHLLEKLDLMSKLLLTKVPISKPQDTKPDTTPQDTTQTETIENLYGKTTGDHLYLIDTYKLSILLAGYIKDLPSISVLQTNLQKAERELVNKYIYDTNWLAKEKIDDKTEEKKTMGLTEKSVFNNYTIENLSRIGSLENMFTSTFDKDTFLDSMNLLGILIKLHRLERTSSEKLLETMYRIYLA